ncbi:MAG TPA: DUF4247 domain-containing protein [Pseudonocardiaceae bacterium]|nr:DUF4247 domain-containing protein [Pseudonocardiaceae bacterium]
MRARSLATTLLATALVLAGCGTGNDIRGFVGNTYALQNRNGDTATYFSKDPVGLTTSRIASAVKPAARKADGGSEYLRYDDDIAIVSAAPGGSTVRVEDLDSRYRSGFFGFLGPGFSPGSPAGSGSGGPGDVK